MSKVIAGMTMSLDGFVEDQDGSVARLYPDFAELSSSELMQQQIRSTGAVVMGRRTYEMAEDPDTYADSYEYQVPIFVVTKQVPARLPKQNDRLTFTFITGGLESDGVARAIDLATAAAGDKDVVVVGGPTIIQECLRRGLVDELQVDIMPVLLCSGLRLFDQLGESDIKLEKVKVWETPTRTSLQLRIVQ